MSMCGVLDKNDVKSKHHGRAQGKQVAVIHAAQVEPSPGRRRHRQQIQSGKRQNHARGSPAIDAAFPTASNTGTSTTETPVRKADFAAVCYFRPVVCNSLPTNRK